MPGSGLTCTLFECWQIVFIIYLSRNSILLMRDRCKSETILSKGCWYPTCRKVLYVLRWNNSLTNRKNLSEAPPYCMTIQSVAPFSKMIKSIKKKSGVGLLVTAAVHQTEPWNALIDHKTRI